MLKRFRLQVMESKKLKLYPKFEILKRCYLNSGVLPVTIEIKHEYDIMSNMRFLVIDC